MKLVDYYKYERKYAVYHRWYIKPVGKLVDGLAAFYHWLRQSK